MPSACRTGENSLGGYWSFGLDLAGALKLGEAALVTAPVA